MTFNWSKRIFAVGPLAIAGKVLVCRLWRWDLVRAGRVWRIGRHVYDNGRVHEVPSPMDIDAALADMEFARSTHAEWAAHLEAHATSGTPCATCDSKPYKLDAAHERLWVEKYDRVIAILQGLEDLQ